MRTFGLLVLTATARAATREVRLHHRLLSEDGTATPFLLRGEVNYDGDALATGARFTAAEDVKGTVLQYLTRVESEPGLLYQVGLEHSGDTGEDEWSISSAKACHLRTSTSDIVSLHIDSHSRAAFAVDYFVLPVAHDGSCPPSSLASSRTPPLSNTTVVLRLPGRPPVPLLRAPPPLTEKGDPVQPEAQQSFIQKYWPYLVGFLVLQFVLGGMAPEEKEGEGAKPAGK